MVEDKAIRQYKLGQVIAALEREPVPPMESATKECQDQITVLLTTCPLPSHPSPWVVEAVCHSIRRHLPTSRIVILCDGPKEMEPDSYPEFKKAARDLGLELAEFAAHHHQTLMVRTAFLSTDFITTPIVIVGDGDWGFRQRYIDWQGIVNTLMDDTNRINHIQIRQDILGVWEFAMDCFGELERYHGINVLPTTNFQAPTHIARTDWYRRIARHLHNPQLLERQDMWDALRLTGGIDEMAAYIPPGPIGRLYHLDGQNVRSPEQVKEIMAL